MDIWQACKDQVTHQTLTGKLIRVVESQEQIATNHLVETLDEQHLLEQLLENNKPKQPLKNKNSPLHYLLATPFRYPPLKYGSRFGKKSEPGLLYGSKKITTALAETAYYRLVFWLGMSAAPRSNKFVTQHTVWGANYTSKKGMVLHKPPFDSFQQQLAAPDNYNASQKIGSELRTFGTEVFEFTSARDVDKGINIALFTPKAFTDYLPDFQQHWLCETSAEKVVFYLARDTEIYTYFFEQFLVDNQFVAPSAV